MIKLKEFHENTGWLFALSLQTAREFYKYEPNLLHIAFFGYSYWFEVPQILKPQKVWVDTSKYEWSKSDGYIDYIQREYGFSYAENHIHIRYGIQPGRWINGDRKNSDHSKCWELPWKAQWRCHMDFLNPDGRLFKRYFDKKSGALDFDSLWTIQNAVPKVIIKFNDFDGEEITATCHIEESMYRKGTSWMKWLGYIIKPKYYRHIDFSFDKQVGREKGSWKGGTTAHSEVISPDESILKAFVRYGTSMTHEKNYGMVNREFTNIRIV